MIHSYHINEFAVQSEVELPCDIGGGEASVTPRFGPLRIRRGSLADVPCVLRRLRRQFAYDVGDGTLLEPELGGLALHVNLRGQVLTVDCPDDRLPSATAWVVRNGLKLATLAHGGLPLQAAALEVGGRYIALLAPPDTGKSTLSWSLLQRGARFGSDDLVPVYLEGRCPTAFPSVSLYPKLRRPSVEGCGLEVSQLLPSTSLAGEEKFYVPLPASRRVTAPAPLFAAIVLETGPAVSPPAVRLLSPEEALAAFQSSLHAVTAMGECVNAKRVHGECGQLAATVPVYALAYRRTFPALEAACAAVRAVATL